MRYITNLLVIAFSILAFTTTQANKNTNPNYVYTIHVGAFEKAQVSDFDDIRSIGYVYAYPLRDNLLQIFLGGYDSRNAARKVLPNVQASGYPDAYVMRRAFDEGDEVVTVQIGLKKAGEDLDYGSFLKAGTIYISQTNNQMRILTGQYMNEKVAQQRAVQLKRIGFKDAFVKIINTVQLIKVTEFETGGTIIVDEVIAVVDTPKGEAVNPKKTPKSYDVLFKKTTNKSKGQTTVPDDVPTNYENTSKRIEIPVKKETVVVLPKIRVKVKRTSAIELQKVLKAEGAYKKSLDGYYGKGTAKAYTIIKKQNRQVKKYLLLSNMMDSEENSSLKTSRLQAIINKVLDEPHDANNLLKAEGSPLAKVYRAYILFQSEGGQAEVDRLMNGAIQQAFKKKKLKNAPRFDFSAKYSYQDLGQLLKHLNYIHAVSGDAEVPCWIFSQHPIEAANAFATGGENLRMQNCGGDFMSWEETKLLKAIAEDLDPAYGLDKKQQAAYTSKRARLFIAPQKLTGAEAKEALIWHKTLWTEMEKWGNADPIHDQRVVALKVAYFQSQVRIEDYFMNKGYTYKEAKPLAMSVLQTIVGAHFVNYLKG